ncbi:unnamed protein product [Nippostrongylus brasiliensis]|uniref:Glutaredoxin domain-containing protein n=1 Tax=Nippostrongylus brasiliensis TaxID=27835 RepID=A0A0N4YUP0_NIPBR|nr:unnamed protein product [Nippostrongylus brasiliensis]
MVTRDTHVSHQMLRSLCGCPPNKVDDKSEVVVQDFRNTVFVYASNKVLVRALVGTLVNALENTNVKAMAMNMVKPTPEMVKVGFCC